VTRSQRDRHAIVVLYDRYFDAVDRYHLLRPHASFGSCRRTKPINPLPGSISVNSFQGM
jgi:hypothetical protein